MAFRISKWPLENACRTNECKDMLLSGDDEQLLTGNFMGDFVKGALNDRFPSRIRQGITLHRRIDSFAGRNEIFKILKSEELVTSL
jgi:acyl carrier protein phosphodiesterase